MRKTFGKIFLVISVGLLINKPLFLHTHPYKITNFDFSGEPKHKHSSHEIKLIDWLNSNNDRYLFNNFAEFDLIIDVYILRKFVFLDLNFIENYVSIIYKRGPPSS